MFFWIPQHLAHFLCLLHVSLSRLVPGENGDCLWLPQLQKTEKQRMWANFPYICVFFRQIAIKWVWGKLKLLIPHALYSLKRKILKVLLIYWTTKYVKYKFLYLHGLKSHVRSKSMLHFFLHQWKYFL